MMRVVITLSLLLAVVLADPVPKLSSSIDDALSLAVSAIQWLVSNCLVVVLGAISTLGFCKFTGSCSLSYEDILPVSQLTSYITPEHIQTAENFLASAVEKYADERRRSYSPINY
ncbi:unnamed protein product [Diatraea saccharalis]|uniref:Uncharacterized protein n=1 Tax=Diatraea saccharalis TaxID=40085 RepID=A0A9N9R042_9NEOP|nr:unnamed protein product [Diatraea saccharalis]